MTHPPRIIQHGDEQIWLSPQGIRWKRRMTWAGALKYSEQELVGWYSYGIDSRDNHGWCFNISDFLMEVKRGADE